MKLMHIAALALVVLLPLMTTGCKSKQTSLTDQWAGTFHPNVTPGSYYRTTGMTTSFYDEQPDSLIGKVPTHILGPRHVIQLLDANAGNGWARVRTEKDEIGFIKFSSIKIVPFEKQPKAPKRKKQWYDE